MKHATTNPEELVNIFKEGHKDYQRLKDLRGTIRQIFGREANVVANYTGGTKTMSVALSMAASPWPSVYHLEASSGHLLFHATGGGNSNRG